MSAARHPLWLRRVAGLTWLAGWVGLIWLVHHPWAGLGGLVGERMRWLERFVLAAGLIVGHAVGDVARLHAAVDRASTGRWLFYPAAVATAIGSVVLQLAGRPDAIGVVLTGFVTTMAGLWSAYLGIGAACREEPGGDQPSREPGLHFCGGGASKIAYSSIATPTNRGTKRTRKPPSRWSASG